LSEDQEAREAAVGIVRAFGAHDRDGYFATFDPAATFLFYGTDRLLGSRAAYEAEWKSWEADGFRVLGCTSTQQRVDVVAPGAAVFTHRVRTRIHDADGDHDLAERETIVLRRDVDGRWLGIHEHLSVDPSGSVPGTP
jgi:ketosteroid isomerase-like protein